MAKITTEEFISRSRIVHGDKYDYSETVYVRAITPAIFICPVHGRFEQEARNHTKGFGCKLCGYARQAIKQTTEGFIKRAIETHGSRYDYSLADYKSAYSKVKIICKEHGEFEQGANHHTKGHGCPRCAAISNTTTQDAFIAKCKAVHGNKYDYSESVYIGNRLPVTFICRKHGRFRQLAQSHTAGRGCRSCSESVGEIAIATALDDLGLKYKREVWFPSCRRIKPLRYDFLVKVSDQKGFLIEFNGQQHYVPTSFRHSAHETDRELKRRLKVNQDRDSIKLNWTQKRRIPLLVIPYWDADKIVYLIQNVVSAL